GGAAATWPCPPRCTRSLTPCGTCSCINLCRHPISLNPPAPSDSLICTYDLPHLLPLPKERTNQRTISDWRKVVLPTQMHDVPKTRRTILLLLGEKARDEGERPNFFHQINRAFQSSARSPAGAILTRRGKNFASGSTRSVCAAMTCSMFL